MIQEQWAFWEKKDDLMVLPGGCSGVMVVAMTRAKMFLAVVADGETIRRGEKGGFLEKWMDWLEENAELRYPDVGMYTD
jgi:hypothetical protein